MDRYMIESPHTAEDCDKAIKQFATAGFLHHFDWGCKDGVHSAWAIIEAENREHAKQIVPWMLRDKARIVKLVKFEDADPLHKDPKQYKNSRGINFGSSYFNPHGLNWL